ncbi:NADH-quinone oxidoreductase subunit NuoE [Candidatus Protochlamydia amoebophila]|uniref:NADH-quinone oxidoreductase subunit E 2 n=1 Tax=Candidatus Protochlamydia amoebophila TaxID=362787 RepID=A0A0C1HEH0_9BACT|nr:NADH-quinone oxidoreductase subunit NuoE [Candidatus Protochlamydia amoebophila]KIC73098.1 NADH-quinone oxidoreductase subunit E 2 [Candidatus Protochlamydia amoebophila]
MLTEETKQAILKLQNLYPNKRSALIPALHLAQAEKGYLPLEVQNEIAFLFDLEPSEVNSIVTFYDMFFEEPVGKHVIHVCKNISCMLRGADGFLARLCQKMHISPGETTQDGEFTVIASECLAACDKAPVMIVDDKVIGPVEITQIDDYIQKAKQSYGHHSPITIEEVEDV